MSSSTDKTGQVTLTQMLGALEGEVASKVSNKLKKLSKKKQLKAPNELEAAKIERQTAYQETNQEVSKWDPIVKRNRQAKQLSFPLDQQKNVLESSASINFKPMNDLEEEIQREIFAPTEEEKLSNAEKQYLKAIGAEEAKERIKDMQKTRVMLSSFESKMKRQNRIKSKSYRRLLKQERLRKHVKKVESSEDKLMEEIERLKRIRAEERASLRHKNTGKWAKHAKFRAKYDEQARNALLDQIGVARKRLDRPSSAQSDSESDRDDDDDDEEDEDEHDDENESDESEATDDDGESSSGGEEQPESSQEQSKSQSNSTTTNDRLIVSTDLISRQMKRKRKSSNEDANSKCSSDEDGDEADDDDDDQEEDEQRKLMSEAFADDDVVGEFKKLKDQLADEEQPKDINTFLPGWGDWAGPGIKTNKRKKRKFVVRAKKVERKDESLSNVIISEKANETMKELQVKTVPRGLKNENRMVKVLSQPVVATFVKQSTHREAIRPRIETKMGARIEPLNARVLEGGSKAKWA